jgi:cysteine desulfurase
LEGIPGTFVNGDRINRLPHTTNISFLGIERQQFVLAADMQKLAVSTGSACSSGSSQPSHVLEAMGSEKPFVESAIRFGFSFQLTVNEIEESVRRISLICNNLRRSK